MDRFIKRVDAKIYYQNISRFPKKCVAALQAMNQPTLVIVGDQDEEFEAQKYEPLFSKYSNAQTQLIPDANHDGILSHPDTFLVVKKWMGELN